MTIDEARGHIGHGVVYRPAHRDAKEGVITSVNDRWVFVRFGSSRQPAACDPADLTLLAKPPTAFTIFPPASGMDDRSAEDNGIIG